MDPPRALAPHARPRPPAPALTRRDALLPGLLLAAGVALVGWLLAAGQTLLLGRAWLDGLLVALVLGVLVRSRGPLPERFEAGVAFAAKPVLEIAIVLLGATLDLRRLVEAGPVLAPLVGGAVFVALGAGYALGRVLGLEPRLATLVACGNAICGNTAIAAAAPVIGARARDVAPAIAFTAVVGVAMVLVLPFLPGPLGITDRDYGVVAGLSVYAVPQVLAATLPVSAVAAQWGTLVKLVRVLMLGPVLLLLGTIARRYGAESRDGRRVHLVPWFVVGFVGLATLRTVGLVPGAAVAAADALARTGTAVALAALGLGVDVRAMRDVGPRVAAAAGGALLLLFAIALAAVRVL